MSSFGSRRSAVGRRGQRRARPSHPGPRNVLALPIGLALATVVVLVVVHLSSGSAHATVGHADAPRPSPSAQDPLATRDMGQVVHDSAGQISVAVDDLRSHREWLLHPGARDQTASIMKVDILETLLRHAMDTHTPLDADQAAMADAMIENSNDTDAQALWEADGGSTGVGAYNTQAGLTQTTLNTHGYWGESVTSAADQITLLRQLVTPGGLLDGPSRRYELKLMGDVEPDQAWGVSAGVTPAASIALKNGWVPLTSSTDWEVNSDGWVRGDGRDYLISVLTAHDPSEAYGIDTIGAVSRLVWSDLRP